MISHTSSNHHGRSTDLIMGLLAFVGTVICVQIFKWQAKDLIWGIWLSSLCFSYAVFGVIGLSMMFGKREGPGSHQAIVGFIVIYFVAGAIGGFHVAHSLALNMFFPIGDAAQVDPNKDFMALPAAWKDVAIRYWPVVIATFVAQWGAIFAKSGVGGGIKVIKESGHLPVVNVIRMHVLIFVFAGLYFAKMDEWAVYPVLVAYFFPWGAFFGKKDAK